MHLLFFHWANRCCKRQNCVRNEVYSAAMFIFFTVNTSTLDFGFVFHSKSWQRKCISVCKSSESNALVKHELSNKSVGVDPVFSLIYCTDSSSNKSSAAFGWLLFERSNKLIACVFAQEKVESAVVRFLHGCRRATLPTPSYEWETWRQGWVSCGNNLHVSCFLDWNKHEKHW